MWWEIAENPRLVLAYYSHPPKLRAVEVHSIRLNRDGPTLELLVEMPSFPDKPSPRWPTNANTAQAVLRFFDLREISLSGWGTTNVGELIIERIGGIVQFRFDGATAQLSGVAGFFDVTSVTGYVTDNTEPHG